MNAMEVLDGIGTSEVIVVQGSGPLGLLATAVAKVSGARRVITIGAPDARLGIASEFGADETLSIERTSPEERNERVRSVTGGRGADIVMEFTGHPDRQKTATHSGIALRPGEGLLEGARFHRKPQGGHSL